MEALPFLLLAVAGLFSGFLSGMSGGGAGMLMVPIFIFAGLPPQVAVATSKMNGIGAAFGGLLAFVKTGQIRKDIVKVMIPIAVVVGITTPFIFSKIDSSIFQVILGIILMILAPTLFIRKKVRVQKSKQNSAAGYTAYSGVLIIQAMFGAGAGSVALFVMTLMLGTTKLEANATKRAVTAVLTPITFVAQFIGGYVAIIYGVIGMVSVFIGTHYGSKVALKKSDRFVTIAMAVIIAISGLVLVVTG